MKPIEQRKQQFKNNLWVLMGRNFDTYHKSMVASFCEYWTECNINGRKMRFEKEKTFDPIKRLARWKFNNKNWNGNKHTNTKLGDLEVKTYKDYGTLHD